MKIIFMGSPDFAVSVLKTMVDNSYVPSIVYASPPSRSGRGMKVNKVPVHEFADFHGIAVRNPVTLKNNEEFEKIASMAPDVIVVVAYGMMIPDSILHLPKFGCINVHPSLLPRWRGASPIQSAIINGDKVTGVSVIRLNSRLDAGPVLIKKTLDILDSDNYPIMHDKLASIGGDAILEVLRQFERGNTSAVEQNDQESTYCGKITNYEIDWNEGATSVSMKIRGLFPKAFFIHKLGFRVRILEADVSEEKFTDEPGAYIDRKIVCGNGSAIALKVVQKEGKKPCLAGDLMHGLR